MRTPHIESCNPHIFMNYANLLEHRGNVSTRLLSCTLRAVARACFQDLGEEGVRVVLPFAARWL